jgi:membrane-bound lytic murein transglycosylase B
MSKQSVQLVKLFIGYLLFAVLVLVFLFFAAKMLFAQSVEEVCRNPEDQNTRNLCAEYERIRKEEKELEGSVQQQKAQSATIQTELSKLTTQIRQSQLSIDRKNLEIRQLSGDISLRDQTVQQLNSKLERGRENLAEIIRRKNELDDVSLVELVLSKQDFSEFFVNADTYSMLQQSLEELFAEIREIRGLTEEEKIKLEKKRAQEQDVKAEIESQQRQVKVKESEQSTLLSHSRRTEATLESYLAEKRARAAQIRSALFQLRDTDGISFGDAVRYAQAASRQTGVRPAFILAILKQESNLGKHLGSCVIYDLESGKSQGVNTGRIFNQGIHPTRDLPVLQTVLRDLGRDPLKTRISCPLITELPDGGFRESGYGGAMGPSQFIPSTWKLYMEQLRGIFGVHPNPWNPEHSIMATALLLRDNGAAAGGFTAERTAALKYYAGGNWNAPHNAFYGNQVMNHVLDIQTNINFLADVD